MHIVGGPPVNSITPPLGTSAPQKTDAPQGKPLSEQAKAAEKVGGIPAEHLEGLKKLADTRQICVCIRAVNPESTGLIREGFGTKDMSIKGKSSVLPPMSALIPRDQTYGKKGADAHEAQKFSEANEASIKKHKAAAVPLDVTVDRMKQMMASSKVGGSSLQVQGTWLDAASNAPLGQRSGTMTGSDGARAFTFWGEKQDDGKVRIFNAVEGPNGTFTKGTPIEVMANRQGKAVTADYDLALVAPRMEDFGAEHTRPLKITSFEEMQIRRGLDPKAAGPKTEFEAGYSGFVDQREATTQEQYAKGKLDGDHEPPMRDFGNIANYTRELIPHLNDACGVSDKAGTSVFHHSDDAGNPFSVEGDNYPMTVILPEKATEGTSGDSIRIIKNHDELLSAFKEMKDAGFMPIGTYKWGEDLMQVRSDSFNEAREAIGQAMKDRLESALPPHVQQEMERAPMQARQERYEAATRAQTGSAVNKEEASGGDRTIAERTEQLQRAQQSETPKPSETIDTGPSIKERTEQLNQASEQATVPRQQADVQGASDLKDRIDFFQQFSSKI